MTPTAPFGDGDRDDRGRFAPGNRGGPGNPHAAQTARLRAALMRKLDEGCIEEAADALMAEVRTGNIMAVREVLDRTIGRPVPSDVLERVARLEELLERMTGQGEEEGGP
ncbi:MAG: hypothetical protein R3B49_10750 [Phycisphaerales bacterium]